MQQFPIYPAEGEPLREAYGGRYECVGVLLHPFFAVATGDEDDPTDAEIATAATPIRWADVCAWAGFGSLRQLNRALLTTIGALRSEFAAPVDAERMDKVLDDAGIWTPEEGFVEALVVGPFAGFLREQGFDHLIACDEFCEATGRVAIPATVGEQRACLVDQPFWTSSVRAPDDSLLAIVHWDSFFTLAFGTATDVDALLDSEGVDGFLCAPDATHETVFVSSR